MKVVDTQQVGTRIEVQCLVWNGQQPLQHEGLAGRRGYDVEVDIALQSYLSFYCETKESFTRPHPVAGPQEIDRLAN